MQQLSFKKTGAVMSLVIAGLLSMTAAGNAMAAKKIYAGERTASASDMNSPYWLGMQYASDFCAKRGATYAYYPRGDVQKTRGQYTLKYYFECYK